MSILPQQLNLNDMQNKWSTIIEPIIAKSLLKGQLLTQINLINGSTVINHKLQRQMQGWFIVDQDSAASIYRSQPLNTLTLTLTSDAATTISLWVF